MPTRSLLLIDVLEGLGGLETDARLRARAAEAAGWAVRGLRLAALPAESAEARDEWSALPVRLASDSAAEIVVASSRAAFQRAAAAAGSRTLRWWPTIVPGCEPLARGTRTPPAWSAGAAGPETAAFDLGVVRPPRERPLVPLWDGAFALVPGPLSGEAGRSLLATFAEVASDRPELDLVVLADLQSEFVRLARDLGVYARVHFAGEAPPEAENTWCATAAAVLLPMSRPVSASLVLRVLAGGAALIPFGDAETVAPLAGWLASRTGAPAGPPASVLAEALAAGPVARRARERGRSLAAGHVPEALSHRLPAPPDAASREIA